MEQTSPKVTRQPGTNKARCAHSASGLFLCRSLFEIGGVRSGEPGGLADGLPVRFAAVLCRSLFEIGGVRSGEPSGLAFGWLAGLLRIENTGPVF